MNVTVQLIQHINISLLGYSFCVIFYWTLDSRILSRTSSSSV